MGSFFAQPATEDPKEDLPQEFNPNTVHVAPKIDIPLDPNDSRFVKSFSEDEVDSYVKFFQEFGFVVVRDVLTSEECQTSIDEIWTFLERGVYKEPESNGKGAASSGIRRDDPKTWNKDWPRMSHAGILGFLPTFTPQALVNRQNPKVYTVFANIMGRKELMVSHDRFGLFRPTCDTKGTVVNPQWRTSYSLHWDVNPWRFTLDDENLEAARQAMKNKVKQLTYDNPDHFIEENAELGTDHEGYVGTQGIINFADNLVEDGGFQMVVGFHKHLKQWAESTKECLAERMMHRDLVKVCVEDPLYKQAQRVSMRKGSLVVWDQRIAHGSAPNNSPNARFCQFLKMSSALDSGSDCAKHRSRTVQEKVDASGVKLTDLGRKLFGLRPWH